MNKQILLNDKLFQFTQSDLPMLITGKEGEGSSLFTISVVADLFSQGKKILFLSGYPMAREEFVRQTNPESFLLDNSAKLAEIDSQSVIFVIRETSHLFLEVIKSLSDIQERIILIKNFELFNDSLFQGVKNYKSLIMSGTIENCSYKHQVKQYNWHTEISFSEPGLPKYHGMIIKGTRSGQVSLQS